MQGDVLGLLFRPYKMPWKVGGRVPMDLLGATFHNVQTCPEDAHTVSISWYIVFKSRLPWTVCADTLH